MQVTAKDGGVEWPALQGPLKQRLLENFPFGDFLVETDAAAHTLLAHGLLELYQLLMVNAVPTDTAIASFASKARRWLDLLRAPGHGLPEDVDHDAGMYPHASVTPYGHALVQHLPEHLRRCQRLGLPLRAFSCSPVEKKHHIQGSFFFKATSRDGGTAGTNSSAATLHWENRQLARQAKEQSVVQHRMVNLRLRVRKPQPQPQPQPAAQVPKAKKQRAAGKKPTKFNVL